MLGTIVEERYLVEAELGAGAMGHVYRARHIKVGRQVAIKVMHHELARVPTIVERFAREARVAARLDHPNLVSVLDVGVTPDAKRLPLIVLELAPGCALADIMVGALHRDTVVSLIRQLLRGLDHAHDAGLVHRDLKPDNILVEQCADGTLVPRIVDFGIAVYSRDDDPIAAQRLTEANMVIGTPSYMSPEQALAKEVDARTDLFSLGVIMYELLSGMPPFDGSGLDVAYAIASLDAPAIAERAGIEVDPLLEVFTRKLMARRLSERFQSAHEALAVLELIESDRMAAAKALGRSAPEPAPPASIVAAPPVHERAPSPALDHIVMPERAVDDVAPPARRSTRITRVEHVAGVRPARRRALWASALAAAAFTAIVGWSARPYSTSPHAEASLAPKLTIEAPTLSPPPSAPLHVEEVAAVVPLPVAHVVQVKPKRAAKTEVQPPVVAVPVVAVAEPAPVPPPPPTGDSAQDVAARYVAVGRLLRGAADDEMRTRYRMIRINEVLANADTRRATLVTLAEIETALKH